MPINRPNTRLTQEQVDALPVERRFRLRGTETTRLDTLIDAAFAFALTMLVISEDGVPDSFEELTTGVMQLPALTVSFGLLMMFWFAHRKWSRRYGLETSATVIVSVSLVFVLLVYIYPLRMIFEGMFSFLTNGRLPWRLSFSSYLQVRGFFAFYAVGFLAMSLLMNALYSSVMKNAKLLLLDEYEILETRHQQHRWTAAAVFSLISITIALAAPVKFVSMAGFIFFGVFVFNFVAGRSHKVKLAKL